MPFLTYSFFRKCYFEWNFRNKKLITNGVSKVELENETADEIFPFLDDVEINRCSNCNLTPKIYKDENIFIKWPEWYLKEELKFKDSNVYEEVNFYLPKAFDYYKKFCIVEKYDVLVMTRTIQIFLRRLSEDFFDHEKIGLIAACSLRIAVQFEYNESSLDEISFASRIFKLSCSNLISTEKDIFRALKFDFYRDTIYENLTIDERILVNSSHRDKYYDFISDINNYYISAKEAAEKFRIEINEL